MDHHCHSIYPMQFYKQLFVSAFVMCGIIKVEVRVINIAEGSTDKSYLDFDNIAYHKNRIK